MAYVLPADFRTETQQSWTQGVTLDETVPDAYLTSVITLVQEDIENQLNDTFEPPSPDNDITLLVNSWGTSRLDVPKRIRSITTVKTRKSTDGTLQLETATDYRVISSVNNPDGGDAELDYIDIFPGQTLTNSGGEWPYGEQTVELVGKFGWSSTPVGIKRLTSLLVYDYVRKSPNQRRVQSFETRDVRYTPIPEEGDSSGIAEVDRLVQRYRRQGVLVR